MIEGNNSPPLIGMPDRHHSGVPQALITHVRQDIGSMEVGRRALTLDQAPTEKARRVVAEEFARAVPVPPAGNPERPPDADVIAGAQWPRQPIR
ncbi:hypothetical protein [Micromonospora musae]|uniref:hypothetical protein n=1 Tax=Micromonospora musae TaxID=1894970 RepID=UPI0018F605BD|nr:hypothetical protein [Micromonospora musae]